MFAKKLSLSLVAMVGSVLTASATQASFTFSADVFTAGASQTNFTESQNSSQEQITTSGSPFNLNNEFSLYNFIATSNSPSSTTAGEVVGSSVTIANISGGTDTLHINLSDTGFRSPVGSHLQIATFGTVTWNPNDHANSGDVVTANSVLNGSNYASTSNTLATLPGSTYMPEQTALVPGNLTAPYTLGSNFSVTLYKDDSVNVNWTSEVAAVPEPTALSLLGMGAVGAILLVARKKNA